MWTQEYAQRLQEGHSLATTAGPVIVHTHADCVPKSDHDRLLRLFAQVPQPDNQEAGKKEKKRRRKTERERERARERERERREGMMAAHA